MPTTELAIIPMKAGSKPGDPNDLSAQVLNDAATVLRQQDGMQQIHFGTQHESPDVLQMMINWDSLKHHQTFMTSSSYGPFMQRFGQVISDPTTVSLTHVDFSPAGNLAKALSAPITEIATFYFDGAPPSDYGSGVEKAEQWVSGVGGGYLGLAWGTTHEEVERDGVKGKAAVVAIGWQSYEAHAAFRGREDFKEKIGLLRSSSKAVEMHHVAFMQAL